MQEAFSWAHPESSPALLSPATLDGMAGMEADIELIELSSSLCTHPTGELLAEQSVQHDQRDCRGDVATIHVPNVTGVLQPRCLQVRLQQAQSCSPCADGGRCSGACRALCGDAEDLGRVPVVECSAAVQCCSVRALQRA